MKLVFGLVSICLLVASCATSPELQKAEVSANANFTPYRPAVDRRTWRGAVAGPITKIATLGSVHLGEFGTSFDPATLEPLLSKLAAFNPTIITHEGLSGEQ